MADVPGIGLSVGATRLAAVTAERGITGDAVRRLPGGFGERCSSASTRSAADSGGVGAEGAGAAPIGGFVDRVGDPIAVIDERGGAHRAEDLLAGALRDIADVALGGRRRPPGLAISLPGHWSPAAVTALRHALPRYFDGTPPVLLPDYAAAVAALIRRPGLPTHGIIALCDIGGSGTSLTLLDADNGYRRVGETRRSGEFGGDLVDRTVLTHVLDALPGRLDATATSAIGTLGELRRECRDAKHRLSAATVTAVTAHLPGGPAELRLTRAELDELTAPGLRRLLDEMESLLTDHGIGPSRLAAVATVGGMAAMPAVTTALSQRLRVPVITAPAPALTAATGAALRAVRNPAAEAATALQSAAVAPAVAPATELANAAPVLALAWSECDDAPEPVPFTGEIDLAALDADIDDADSYGPDVDREPAEAGENRTTARPLIAFDPVPEPPAVPDTRRRHPVLTALVAAALIAGGISGVAVALTYTSSESSTATQAAPVTAAPAASPAPQADAPTMAPVATPVAQTGTAPVAPTVAAPAAPVAEAPQVVQGPVVQVNNQRPIAAAPAPEPAAAPAEIPAPAVDPVAVPFPVPSLQIPDLTLGLPILGDGLPRGNQPSQPREAPASPTPSPTSPAPSPKPSPEPSSPKPAPSSPSPTPKSPEPSAPSSTATPPSPTHSAPAPSPSPAPKRQEPEPQEPAPSAGSPASTANPDARGHHGQ
ncbi:Hsp70 family protein [Mycolicibacterium insubricum]|uniref:Molecular chaperone n=1 Tax=Mycolicibacterium insubricum TaxID=444597 RepID=A0A1X0DQI3_9MYCO|nr:Hsp70 family protein [Mycolicibacterium insubricum]ORA74140.1 hypothetical protein BST26_00765 [Mycolicibacterium insubricum]